MNTNLFNHSIVYKLADSVEYSEGSVVSKIILRNDKGNLTLFAFAKGQGLSEHSAPFDAIVQIIDGEGIIFIDKVEHVVKTGEFIIMPANVPHALSAKEKFKMLLIMVKGQ